MTAFRHEPEEAAVLERIRHGDPVEHIRRAMREKTMRALRDVLAPMHGEQLVEMTRLREELAELREQIRDRLREEVDRGVDFGRAAEMRSRRDIFAAGEREAALESARLVRDVMPRAVPLPHPHETLRHALSLSPKGGLALEFGVYTGATLGTIAEVRDDGAVYGFDSFKGLPEHWRSGFPEGAFDAEGLPEVAGAELVVGWFGEVLPGFLADHQGSVDFLHVDCDIYSSTKKVLEMVGPRLRPGSVVLFDEYFNYPGWQHHEYLAWQEHAERTGIKFNYEAYTIDNEQVVVRIVDD